MTPTSAFELDPFALADADTSEAKAFTTYLGYWTCLSESVRQAHGEQALPSVLRALKALPAFRSLAGKGPPKEPEPVRQLLLNGWTSELRLHLIPLEDASRLWIGNHGAPIDAYYATSRVASAFLVIRDGSAPQQHRGLLNAVERLVTAQRLLPYPWNLTCLAVHPAKAYGGFADPPGFSSNLSSRANVHDRMAMILRTTRDRGVKKRVQEEKARLRTRKAPKNEHVRQDARLAPTTVFDFAWRMRVRSNYGDPGMFHIGTLTEDRAGTYAAAVRSWTSSTMGLFEALIAQRAPKVLEEAAVFFISRDRSGLAAGLLASRLKDIGLLAP